MSVTPETYLERVSALCARPILSDPDARLTFFYRLQAYWTRKLSQTEKGKQTEYTADQIYFILDALSANIKDLRSPQNDVTHEKT